MNVKITSASALLVSIVAAGCASDRGDAQESIHRGALAEKAVSAGLPKAKVVALEQSGDPFLHRTGHQVAAIKKDLYVDRGVENNIDTQTNTFRPDLFRFHPKSHDRIVETQLQERGDVVPPATSYHCMVADDRQGGSLLSFGGAHFLFEGDPNFFQSLVVYDTLYRYDVPKKRWEAIAPASTKPAARAGCNAEFHDGSMYMFGGLSRFLSLNNELWRFDTATNEWTQLTPNGPVPEPRFIGATVTDHDAEKLYLYNGHHLGPFGFESIGDFWVYDIPSNTFRQLPPIPGEPRDEGTLSLLRSPSGKKYIVFSGGHTEASQLCQGFTELTTAIGEIWAFDPDTESWNQLAIEGATPRIEFVRGATIDNTHYLVGGWYDVPDPTRICRQVWNESVYAITLVDD